MRNRATLFRAALVLWAVGLVASPSYAENMISKDDADFIFSLTRSEWEAYARRVVHPWGWETRVTAMSTGSVMMSIHVQNGMALSVRPIFSDDHSTPDMLIVGGWHVTGTSSFTESLKQSINQAVRHDLGPAYSVSVNFERVSRFDVVELTITKAGGVPKNGPAEIPPPSAER
jgi:hypothetical protein